MSLGRDTLSLGEPLNVYGVVVVVVVRVSSMVVKRRSCRARIAKRGWGTSWVTNLRKVLPGA